MELISGINSKHKREEKTGEPVRVEKKGKRRDEERAVITLFWGEASLSAVLSH